MTTIHAILGTTLAAALLVAPVCASAQGTSASTDQGAAASSASASSAITTSTDPVRAAKVEAEARRIKEHALTTPAPSARGKSAGGFDYVSGGVSVGEQVAMHSERAKYSLWVATVAKPSGAYLADIHLRIEDLKTKQVVLDQQMNGPWLMIALPPGRYDIVGTRAAEGQPAVTQHAFARVLATGQRQAVLRFPSKAEVGTPEQRPFKGNPFGAPQSK